MLSTWSSLGSSGEIFLYLLVLFFIKTIFSDALPSLLDHLSFLDKNIAASCVFYYGIRSGGLADWINTLGLLLSNLEVASTTR